MDKDVTYWDYLDLDKILNSQGGVERDESKINNDELHFIIIHQVYELWFKLAIRELHDARNILTQEFVPEDDIPKVVGALTRVIEIFKLAIQQFTLLETMSAQDFLYFRSKLGTASGFQSIQMREIEILLGLDKNTRVGLGNSNVLDVLKIMLEKSPNKDEMISRLERVENGVSFKHGLLNWLSRTPIDGITFSNENYESQVTQFMNDYFSNYCILQDKMAEGLIKSQIDSKENIKRRFALNKDTAKIFLEATDVDVNQREFTKKYRAGILFIESYRNLPLISWPRRFLESIVEMEELFILWRFRHTRMVERMIGRRVGTGGSSGVEYLDSTTKYRIFNDLWDVRSLLLPVEHVPKLKNKMFYNFSTNN